MQQGRTAQRRGAGRVGEREGMQEGSTGTATRRRVLHFNAHHVAQACSVSLRCVADATCPRRPINAQGTADAAAASRGPEEGLVGGSRGGHLAAANNNK